MMSRIPVLLAIFAASSLAACDSNDSDSRCLTVTPNEGYTLSGEAGSTNFAPTMKAYFVRNTCDNEVDVSIEEDERWLDIDIIGFSAESGTLAGDGDFNLTVGVVYGDDNPERLNQLEAGTYTSEVRFVDETNNRTITHAVNLTVQ